VVGDRIRAWQLCRLPSWLSGYLVAVDVCYLLALTATAALTRYTARDLGWFTVLLLFGAIAIELARHQGENAEPSRDVHGVWIIPIALLLPPVFSMLAPAAKALLLQWRGEVKPPHRRAFTAATHGLAYGAVSLAFHALAPHGTHWLVWGGLAACAALIQNAAASALIAVAVKGTDPSVKVFAPDALYNDLAELTAGTVLAVMLAATGAWELLLLALPLVTLLYRSVRHAQLSDAARLDAKTGLLNAAAWQREARAEIIRATRTGTPVSIAILDIDHFKQVNDTFGHLTGDSLLIALADLIRRQLREYDVSGRFGGEEFTILFPHTDAAAAAQIAERLRGMAAELSVGQARITVSLGVCTLAPGAPAYAPADYGSADSDLAGSDSAARAQAAGAPPGSPGRNARGSMPGADLNEMLAAADAALYHAKSNGRNQVCAPHAYQLPRQLSPAHHP
jgi:diguanylate cyclase (GGDEF)-like protein